VKSKADTAGTGFYLGAKKDAYAELGGFTFQQRTRIGGFKLGLGVNFTIYYVDAEELLQGIIHTRAFTIGPITMTKYYDKRGEEIGTTVTIYGAGGGLAYEEGISEGLIFPLQ
jgi:hypothetical protein